MSTSTHPIIILFDSDVEDAFSSTDYTAASPNYSSAIPRNTSSDSKTERAYYATNKESSNSLSSSTISPPPAPRVRAPRAPIAPPPFFPPPLVLPSSPLSHLQDSVPKEIMPPQKRAHFLSPPSSPTDLSALPMVFKIKESSQTQQPTIFTLMTRLERHEEQINAILNHLDEFPFERIKQIKYGIEGLVDSRVSMALLPPGFLEPLYPGIMDMINAQDIKHMFPPTPPKDTEPPVGSPIPSSPSLSVGSSSLVRSTTPPLDYSFDESIFAELDNSL
nr:hypothetical protein [Tanacetum cinerariifolium]